MSRRQRIADRARRLLVLAPALALAASAAWAGQPVSAHASPDAWNTRPEPSTRATQQACADLLFVGVRGSGEPPGYGPTVSRVRDGLAERWSSGTVRQVWLDYPAGDPHTLADVPLSSLLLDQPMPQTTYFTSADTGATRLGAVLSDSANRCPNERTIVAGFSQGAQVITDALSSVPEAPSRLAAAVLVGNPSHYPGQSVRELSGSASQNAIGLGAMLHLLREQGRRGDQTNRDQAVRNLIQTTLNLYQGRVDTQAIRQAMVGQHSEIPADAYESTYSVCLDGDLVCDAGRSLAEVMVQSTSLDEEIRRTRPIHLGYSPAVLKPTLDAAAQAIAGVPRATPSPGEPSQGPARRVESAAAARPGWQFAVVGGAAAIPLAGLAYLLGRRHGRRHARPAAP